MPTSFSSYDTDQDGVISAEEWASYYPDGGGPATDPAAPAEPFDLDTFIDKVSSGNFTDDDMLAFSNWYMGQQLGQQAGQMDYQNKYLEHLGMVLEGNNAALAQAQQEMEFQQGPYWDWYVNDYFPHQQELDRLNFDTQKVVAGAEQAKAKDYALGQFYGTESSKYGADAARWQYLQMTGGQQPPSRQQERREPRMASAVLGAY